MIPSMNDNLRYKFSLRLPSPIDLFQHLWTLARLNTDGAARWSTFSVEQASSSLPEVSLSMLIGSKMSVETTDRVFAYWAFRNMSSMRVAKMGPMSPSALEGTIKVVEAEKMRR